MSDSYSQPTFHGKLFDVHNLEVLPRDTSDYHPSPSENDHLLRGENDLPQLRLVELND